MSIHIETLGCKMNLVDSESIQKRLQEAGNIIWFCRENFFLERKSKISHEVLSSSLIQLAFIALLLKRS